MARGVIKWGYSYKKTTLVVCCINIVIALYVLRFLYSSLSVYSNGVDDVVRYSPGQIVQMEDSIRIRRAHEPVELISLVKEFREDLSEERITIELSKEVRQKITNEILQRLRSVNAGTNITLQREAVESWRREKLQEVKQLYLRAGDLNSTIIQEEAGMLTRLLESDWIALSENIGLWIPAEIVNHERDDKPADAAEDEEDILPGRPMPPECHTELHTDYGGDAVRWGLTHPKESAADCCQACIDQAKKAKPGEKRCNIWVYCPSETGCYSPDIYVHKNQECWLKYAEKPRVNFKHRYSESYRNSHPNAPLIVPWVAGVIRV